MYFYDDLTRPLAVSGFLGRVVKADDNAREIGGPASLAAGDSRDKNTLETRIADAKLPFNLKLYVNFKAGDKEQVFDFTFAAYSKEP